MTSTAVCFKIKNYWVSSPCNPGNWVTSRSSERSSTMLGPFNSAVKYKEQGSIIRILEYSGPVRDDGAFGTYSQ